MVTRREFDSYRAIQKWGKYNMLSDQAFLATNIKDRRVYNDIIENYDKYIDMYGCAWNLIKDAEDLVRYMPNLCKLARETDVVYFNKNGLSMPLPMNAREQMYRAEESIGGIVYAVIDTECELYGENVKMRSFLFYSQLDEDEPIYTEPFDDNSITTYAYVINETWDIEEAGSITIKESSQDGMTITTYRVF